MMTKFITREQLAQTQQNATHDFLAAMAVQIDYRRSAPMSSDRVVEVWDMLKRELDAKLESAMSDYYESNGIIPYTSEEQA